MTIIFKLIVSDNKHSNINRNYYFTLLFYYKYTLVVLWVSRRILLWCGGFTNKFFKLSLCVSHCCISAFWFLLVLMMHFCCCRWLSGLICRGVVIVIEFLRGGGWGFGLLGCVSSDSASKCAGWNVVEREAWDCCRFLDPIWKLNKYNYKYSVCLFEGDNHLSNLQCSNLIPPLFFLL